MKMLSKSRHKITFGGIILPNYIIKLYFIISKHKRLKLKGRYIKYIHAGLRRIYK